MTKHENLRQLSAGFVLGALDPDERRRFEDHLAGCSECRREVASFAPIPGLLSRVDRVAVPLPDHVVDGAASRARAEWAIMVRSRRSWRWTAVVASLVAALLAIAAFLPQRSGSRPVELTLQSGSVTGKVTLHSRTWGTALHLELGGLPPRDRYVAWVIDDSGGRQQAATWGPTPAGGARLDGASSIPVERVAAVVITSADQAETLLTATPDDGSRFRP